MSQYYKFYLDPGKTYICGDVENDLSTYNDFIEIKNAKLCLSTKPQELKFVDNDVCFLNKTRILYYSK